MDAKNKENEEITVRDPYCYVESLEFNDGTQLDVRQNDIVVFVGPNNAGKSRSLRDIYDLYCSANNNHVVVQRIGLHRGAYEDVLKRIEECSVVRKDGGNEYYYGFGYGIFKGFVDSWVRSKSGLNDLQKFYCDYIGTVDRLTECNQCDAMDQVQSCSKALQIVAKKEGLLDKLSDAFEKAFQQEIRIQGAFTGKLTMRCSDRFPTQGPLSGKSSAISKYDEELATYPALFEQGDGMKSFAGILLRLLGDQYSSFFIDEPESFLHPPQARVMGQTIGGFLNEKQQAFIATHSEAFLQGLLQKCPDRVKIVRVARKGDANSIKVLDNESFRTIWNDSILLYSNVMEGLFHKTVVICESDSDCRFYSMLDNWVKRQDGRYSEALFVASYGKQRLKVIVKALRSLNVDYRVICDIDIINDKSNDLKALGEVVGLEWDDALKAGYNDLVSSFSNDTGIKVTSVDLAWNQVKSECRGGVLKSKDIEIIKVALEKDSRIGNIKHAGREAIPSGKPMNGFNLLDKRLKEKNVFMVPVGELEGFVRDVGGHGPNWVNDVLIAYPDLSDQVYNKAKLFVKEVRA